VRDYFPLFPYVCVYVHVCLWTYVRTHFCVYIFLVPSFECQCGPFVMSAYPVSRASHRYRVTQSAVSDESDRGINWILKLERVTGVYPQSMSNKGSEFLKS